MYVRKFYNEHDVPASVGAPPLDTQLHVRKVLVFIFLQPGH